MEKISAVCVSLALLAAGPAQADPSFECSVSNDSQVEIGNCVGEMSDVVDKSVDLAFGFAMETAKELDTTTGRDVAVKALTTSQQTWSAFRDAQCEYVGSTFGGGSGTSIAISSCRIELGRQRVSTLMNGL